MLHPVGAHFNPDTMRMEVTDFGAIIFNIVAQEKFVHTVSAGYVTGAMFVASVSAMYLLLGKHIEIARRSLTVAVSFGLASALSVVVLGDSSGYTATENQKMKISSIEAMWETEPPPASFTLFGFPNQAEHRTDYAVRIPWVLGLITTHSLDEKVPGITDLVQRNEDHIWSGLLAYSALEKLRTDKTDVNARAQLEQYADDLGYALLLKKIRPDIQNATEAEIKEAAWSTVPPVALLFWSFRLMVGLGFYFIFLFGLAFYLISTGPILRTRWLLWALAFTLPLPWIAAEIGLDRCGSRPPAMGRRRRAADVSCRIEHFGKQCSRHPLRLHWLLFGTPACRNLSHGPGNSARPGRHRAGAPRSRHAHPKRRGIGSKGAHHAGL